MPTAAGRQGGMFAKEGEAHHLEGSRLILFANFIVGIGFNSTWSVLQLLVVGRYPLR